VGVAELVDLLVDLLVVEVVGLLGLLLVKVVELVDLLLVEDVVG
jgi:hypothetical protein